MNLKEQSMELTVQTDTVNYINSKHYSRTFGHIFTAHSYCKYDFKIYTQQKIHLRIGNIFKLDRGTADQAAGPHPGTPQWKKIKIDASVCSLFGRSHYSNKKGRLRNDVDW
jgi:hypothetical protein